MFLQKNQNSIKDTFQTTDISWLKINKRQEDNFPHILAHIEDSYYRMDIHEYYVDAGLEPILIDIN